MPRVSANSSCASGYVVDLFFNCFLFCFVFVRKQSSKSKEASTTLLPIFDYESACRLENLTISQCFLAFDNKWNFIVILFIVSILVLPLYLMIFSEKCKNKMNLALSLKIFTYFISKTGLFANFVTSLKFCPDVTTLKFCC